MSASHGLTESHMRKIFTSLACFPEVERAILFGSRAKQTYKPGSDVDLALVGESLDWRLIGRIYDALDDQFLPLHFSLIHLQEATDPDLAAHIMRVGIPIYYRDWVTAHTRQVDGLDADSPQSRARRVEGSGTSLR